MHGTGIKTPKGIVTGLPPGEQTWMTIEQAAIMTSAFVSNLNASKDWPTIQYVLLDIESATGYAFSPDGGDDEKGVFIRFRFEAEYPVTVGSRINILPYKNH